MVNVDQIGSWTERYAPFTDEARILAAVDCIRAVTDSNGRPTIRSIREMMLRLYGGGISNATISSVLIESFGPSTVYHAAPARLSRSGWQVGPAPRSPGVYAIYRDEHLVYIGCSTSLAARLAGHPILGRIRRQGCVATYKWRATAAGEHLAVEYRLIHRLQPALNGTYIRSRMA